MHYLSRNLSTPTAGDTFQVDGEDYVLQGKIGDGAAGIVRKATRRKDGVTRAVKFLAPDPKYLDEAMFDDVAARFKREGQRATALEHPHLLSIFNYCENQNGDNYQDRKVKNPFILMEHVNG